MKSISILAILSPGALAQVVADPTPPANLNDLVEKGPRTNYFSIYSTAIPYDDRFIGIGAGIFPDGGTTNYWIGCTKADYTTSGGYAGCGRNDFYTRCDGNIARAKDGTDITCVTSEGFACQTAQIFADLDTEDYVSWVKCGVRGEKTQLARTPTGVSTTLSGVPEATAGGILTDPNPIPTSRSSSTSGSGSITGLVTASLSTSVVITTTTTTAGAAERMGASIAVVLSCAVLAVLVM